MALSANTVWEVRTAGLDTNGGGFVTGASGTDYSQQDAKNTVGSNISTTDAVAVGTTVITSATATFTSAIVGNIIYLQGGTGALAAGWYQVASFTNSTTIDVDRNVAAGTGITMNIGGAFLTIGQALSLMTIIDMTAYVKSGTYNLTAALNTPAISGGTFYETKVSGYETTRNDNPTGSSRPTVKTNGNAINALEIDSQAGWAFENFIFDGSAGGGAAGLIGISQAADWVTVVNCKVMNFATEGVAIGSSSELTTIYSQMEITGCALGLRTVRPGQTTIEDSWIHDNTGAGLNISPGVEVRRCLIDSNSGGSSDGILIDTATNGFGNVIVDCVIYGNGRDGIRGVAAFAPLGCLIRNNIISTNGGFGISFASVRARASQSIDYNAFFNNTSGARSGVVAGPHDVTLTADPFTNAAGSDFSLNTTAGGGAACRAAGYPGAFPGATSTGYLDIGAVQHTDPASFAPSVME